MIKVIIKKVQNSPFTGTGGEEINYYWTRATLPDGFTIRFGSSYDHTDNIGQEVDIELEKVKYSNGKDGWKEVLD